MPLCLARKPFVWLLMLAIQTLAGHAESAGASAPDVHIVREGEVLSRMAQRYFGRPIYTRSGALKKILSLNPGLEPPFRIYPGQSIRVGGDSEDETQPLPSDRKPSGTEPQTQPEARTLPQPQPQPRDAFRAANSIEVAPAWEFFRIDGFDPVNLGRAAILSRTHLNVPVFWRQHWSRSSSSYVRFRVSHTTFDPNASTVLTTGALTQYGFAMGGRHEWARGQFIGGEASLDQRPFFAAPNISSVAIQSVIIPRIAVRSETTLAQTDPFRFGFHLEGGFLLPSYSSSYSIRSGYEYGGGLFLEQSFERSLIGASISFKQAQQDSSIVEQNITTLGFGLHYRIRFELSQPSSKEGGS